MKEEQINEQLQQQKKRLPVGMTDKEYLEFTSGHCESKRLLEEIRHGWQKAVAMNLNPSIWPYLHRYHLSN
jgi:hypothetical protein